jgi:hypothetical protein
LPGERFVASVYIQTHRCTGAVWLGFYNAAGTALGYNAGTAAGNYGVANVLSSYNRSYILGVAPAGTAFARLFIRKANTDAGQTDSFIWWAGPQLERVNSNQTLPSPYSPGPPSSTRQLGYVGALNADLTSANTAAAFAGQGALATQNTVDWATGVTGKPAGFGEVTVGVGETIKKYMAAYATATFIGGYGATASTATNGNRSARLLANGSVFATGDAWFAGPGEPGSGEVTGTFTNGATAQLVSFSVGYSGSAVANDTTKIFCRG